MPHSTLWMCGADVSLVLVCRADRRFLVANALVDSLPIIYCNDGFCELVGYTRAELMQRSCVCEFLHGPLTDPDAVAAFRDALDNMVERQTELLYYRKDGSKFLCSQVVAPIRNEDGDICMFIVNFEDVTDAPYKADEEAAGGLAVPASADDLAPLPQALVRTCARAAGRSRSLRLRMPGSRRTSFALSKSTTTEEDDAAPESMRALVVSSSDTPEQQPTTTVVTRPTKAVAVLAPYEQRALDKGGSAAPHRQQRGQPSASKRVLRVGPGPLRYSDRPDEGKVSVPESGDGGPPQGQLALVHGLQAGPQGGPVAQLQAARRREGGPEAAERRWCVGLCCALGGKAVGCASEQLRILPVQSAACTASRFGLEKRRCRARENNAGKRQCEDAMPRRAARSERELVPVAALAGDAIVACAAPLPPPCSQPPPSDLENSNRPEPALRLQQLRSPTVVREEDKNFVRAAA
ncbi:hypothetical protein MRX96_012524 [Rhipicephalus microplus]